jgi:glutathione S-transferase
MLTLYTFSPGRHSDRFMAITSRGQVPALDDDGLIVTEARV